MKEKKSSVVFATAQQIGKSLFLPIAVLPFAGILLGIGSSFTNETTIATYGLSGVLHPGTLLYSIMLMLNYAGNAIFSNLALIFALAVALGMAKKEKGVAVLSAGIFYLIMLTTINVLLTLNGSIVDGQIAEGVKEGAIANVLGIQTLQMGVFGGIIAGLITAVLCNKFYKTQLPDALSFFAGTRFVPIVSMVFAIITDFVCCLAGHSERHLCTGRSGTGFRLLWNLPVRLHRACADSVWPASYLLHAVLADRRWRHSCHRRRDRYGCTEHLLCRAGIPEHRQVLCRRLPFPDR